MSEINSVETKLIRILAVIALVAVLGVLGILPYRLYARDIRGAEVQAHRIASVLHAALSERIAEGEDVSELVNRFQAIADLQIRLRQLGDGEVHPVVTSGRAWSELDGTDLTYTGVPILDRAGGIWLAEMNFDLSPMKRESVRLIVDLVGAVIAGSIAFSALVYWLVRRHLVEPLREATRALRAHKDACQSIELPAFASREMNDLARALESACRVERAGA